MKKRLIILVKTLPAAMLLAAVFYVPLGFSANEEEHSARFRNDTYHYNGPVLPSSEFMDKDNWDTLLDTDNFQCAGALPVPCEIEIPQEYDGDLEAYLNALETPAAVLSKSTRRQSISP